MEKNEEQLLENQNANLNAVEHSETINVENIEPSKNEFSGSSTKKFKSVEALSKAYENLEREFTKKCQKLNELMSENNTEVLPQYKKEDWLVKVSNFIAENKFAKDYTKQIADVLLEDEALAKKEDALSLAYSKVLNDNFKTKEELAEDEDFLNQFVYKNEKIKTKIIEDYLLEINNNQTVPLLSKVKGTSSVSSPKFIPKSLKEASRYAEQILKK
ncbi:MAG: hypothetical protein E7359_00525 [Clostridiales bacterium]|nr:hypothetical protein [Clostridiales bacterium]